MFRFVPMSLMAVMIVIINTNTVVAQQSPQDKALARAQYMLRQVNAEKAQLQTEVLELKKSLTSLEKELEQTKNSAERKEGKLKNTLASWKESHQELKEKLAMVLGMMNERNYTMAVLTENLQRQTGNFKVCYANNQSLSEINNKLLDRYEGKGAWDVIAQNEPFTGFKQVDIENFVQDYRYQIEDLNLELNQQQIQEMTN